jgi:hypothetical protein
MAWRSASSLRAEAEIRREFGLSNALLSALILLPIGPLAMVVGSLLAPFPFAHALAATCFIPALVVARRHGRVLETAGTDRVRGLQSAISQATGASIVGLCYLLASFSVSLGAKFVAQ